MKKACREIAEIISDYDSSDCSISEKELVEQHIISCPECKKMLEKQQNLLVSLRYEAHKVQNTSFLVNLSDLQKVDSQAENQNLLSRLMNLRFKWLIISPAFAVCLLLLLLIYPKEKIVSKKVNASVLLGSLIRNGHKVQLIDGTLLAGVKYSCPTKTKIKFQQGTSELKAKSIFALASDSMSLFEGTAIFKIMPSDKNFVVTTNLAKIHVLGTMFKVSTNALSTRILLENGRIKVETDKTSKILKGKCRCDILAGGVIQEVIEKSRQKSIVLPVKKINEEITREEKNKKIVSPKALDEDQKSITKIASHSPILDNTEIIQNEDDQQILSPEDALLNY